MDNGYIKLWRKSLESQVWQNANLWQVWCWCLMKASHKEQFISMVVGKGTTGVKIGVGQFIFGRHQAATELRMSASTVRNQIEKLKNIENLDIQSNNHYSIITVNNWDTYQVCENLMDSQEDSNRTAIGQQTDTYKNVKNVKNVKKKNKYNVVLSNNGIPYEEIISYLNEKSKSSYRANIDKNRILIRVRWDEGFRVEDFKKVIDNMVGEWFGDQKMERYLRPETLFGNKFEGYLNRKPRPEMKEGEEPF